MRKFKQQAIYQRRLPLTRQNLESFLEARQRKTNIFQRLQSYLLLGLAAIVFLLAAFTLILHFYNAPVEFSMRDWVQVRNLTLAEPVTTRVNGVLEQVFVGQGQLVQKGELLGAIQTAEIELNYQENRRNFIDKILELHCLTSLQSQSSAFKLPYDAQILVDHMIGQYDSTYKIEQCERALLRNIFKDQSLEEIIAALEDQSKVLKDAMTIRGAIKNTSNLGSIPSRELGEDIGFPFDSDQQALKKAYRDQYFPMLQFAQVEQKLQETRKTYFSRKLQKEEDLEAAIEQTIQELRYLDGQLRAMNKKLENNFIYASITGTIIGSRLSKVGTYFKENEIIFTLQPIENKFQISVLLDEQNSHRFSSGVATVISLENNQKNGDILNATTATVLRKPNGKLEAILDLDGNSKRNSEIILDTGYHGEGSQRFLANISIGQSKVWDTISNIIFHKRTPTDI